MILGTTFVSPDEPCYALVEMNLQSPGSRGQRRYQIIYVMRGDQRAEYRRELGPVVPAQQFRIPGGVFYPETGRTDIVETVGHLQDVADYLRDGRIPEPEMEPSNLLAEWADQIEQRQWAARGRGMSIVKN